MGEYLKLLENTLKEGLGGNYYRRAEHTGRDYASGKGGFGRRGRLHPAADEGSIELDPQQKAERKFLKAHISGDTNDMASAKKDLQQVHDEHYGFDKKGDYSGVIKHLQSLSKEKDRPEHDAKARAALAQHYADNFHDHEHHPLTESTTKKLDEMMPGAYELADTMDVKDDSGASLVDPRKYEKIESKPKKKKKNTNTPVKESITFSDKLDILFEKHTPKVIRKHNKLQRRIDVADKAKEAAEKAHDEAFGKDMEAAKGHAKEAQKHGKTIEKLERKKDELPTDANKQLRQTRNEEKARKNKIEKLGKSALSYAKYKKDKEESTLGWGE